MTSLPDKRSPDVCPTCGSADGYVPHGAAPSAILPTPAYYMSTGQVDELRRLVRNEAIEECAKVADTYRGVQDCANEIAAAIRARSDGEVAK